MSIWWPFKGASSSDYIKPEYPKYTSTYNVPQPASVWTWTTTTTRVKPFYHPATYSKRWKR